MEKFILYQKARKCNKEIARFLKTLKTDYYKKDQLKRSTNSFVLNIAEANGRITPKDRTNFFGIARGSVFESYAGINLLEDEDMIAEDKASQYKEQLDELSRMLTAIIMNNQKARK